MPIIIYLFKIWIVGMAVAASMGPIEIIAINHTLSWGRKGALLVGLGAALADGVHRILMIPFSGNFWFNTLSIYLENGFQLLEGLLLLFLAYQEGIPGHQRPRETNPRKIVRNIFFLKILRPSSMTMGLGLMGLFESVGLQKTLLGTMTTILGIFLGSMTWWYLLGTILSKIKNNLQNVWIEKIHQILCVILAIFGLMSIFNGLMTNSRLSLTKESHFPMHPIPIHPNQ